MTHGKEPDAVTDPLVLTGHPDAVLKQRDHVNALENQLIKVLELQVDLRRRVDDCEIRLRYLES